jgi:enoyl-CoA hydratase/carnithine racemase
MWYFYTTFPSALALVIVSFKGAPTALVKPTNLSDITLELGQRLARHMTKVLKQQALNDEVVLREDRGPVAVLTLNRPEARNSLSLEMIAALHSEVEDLGGSDAVRTIVITGAGSAFSSGHDLKEMSAHRNDPDRGRAFFAKTMSACSDMMMSIVRSPKPVIAAVNGIATAAGCQLVASCDLAVASIDARFATPGVNIGLFCSTPMVALSRNVSRKAAMEMLLLGEMVGAEDAQALGLTNRVVAADRVVNEAVELGRQIAAKPKRTLKIGKEAFYRQLEMPLEEAYAYTSSVMVENMLDEEAKEGIGAFIDKRAPRWPR